MPVKSPAADGSEPRWYKSSHSNPDGAACVEAALTPGTIHIRDSKHPLGPHLTFGKIGWAAFVAHSSRSQA